MNVMQLRFKTILKDFCILYFYFYQTLLVENFKTFLALCMFRFLSLTRIRRSNFSYLTSFYHSFQSIKSTTTMKLLAQTTAISFSYYFLLVIRAGATADIVLVCLQEWGILFLKTSY